MASGWDNQLTRQIGEHLVTAELGKRGYLAAPFAGNVPELDIVATDRNGNTVPIQVKTIRPGSTWQLSANKYLDVEDTPSGQVIVGPTKLRHPNMICIFVGLRARSADRFYICAQLDFQKVVAARYAVKQPPYSRNPHHHAVLKREVAQYRDNWAALEKAFENRAAGISVA